MAGPGRGQGVPHGSFCRPDLTAQLHVYGPGLSVSQSARQRPYRILGEAESSDIAPGGKDAGPGGLGALPDRERSDACSSLGHCLVGIVHGGRLLVYSDEEWLGCSTDYTADPVEPGQYAGT